MATVLKFSVIKSSDFKSLLFTDSTGLKPTISDGYGSPDLIIANITTFTVGIVFPGTSTLITSPNLTNSAADTTTTLTADMFNGQAFVDGHYIVTFSASDGTINISTTKEFFITDETECCVTKMNVGAKIKKDCLEKEDLKPKIADMYLNSAKYAYFNCGLKEKANDFLQGASDLCKECGCGCK